MSENNQQCPFKYWNDFQVNIPFNENSPLVKPTRLAIQWFLKINSSNDSSIGISSPSSIAIQWQRIPVEILNCFLSTSSSSSSSSSNTPDFPWDKVQFLIDALGLGFSQVAPELHNLRKRLGFSNFDSIVVARLLGYQNITSFKKFKAGIVGEYVSVCGNIVRVSVSSPLLLAMKFTCSSCSFEQWVHFPDGIYTTPSRCIYPRCKSKSLIAKRDHDSCKSVNWQKIRIQEKPSNSQIDLGRVPRTIECELSRDLVGKFVPGDVAIISGVVKMLAIQDSKKKFGEVYHLYLEANSMIKMSSEISGDSIHEFSIAQDSMALCAPIKSEFNKSKDYVEISKRDIEGIREIANFKGDIFNLLTHSLCPLIYGHNLIKAGLLLTLFGGRQRTEEHETMRPDCHFLMVGDPGLGKSQLLLATVKLAPRGVYVSGNMTSTAGLTVTVSRDPTTGENALEAGALVLGDQGVCCIDEFDKMTDHQALLGAMEQQEISIAKAGIICSLPCRTSVIAAANPVGGHYNQTKSISDNLKMEPALLSRFDLLFIMLDRPNKEMDKFLSEHIIKNHNGMKEEENLEKRPFRTFMVQDSQPDSTHCPRTLKERLFDSIALSKDPIPPNLLRKFISYARTYTKPRLSPEAASVIQTFYLELRSKSKSQDAIPITTRQLESLIRLSEARCRSELRDVVTANDARDVIELMRESIAAVSSVGPQNFDPYDNPGINPKGAGQTGARNLLAKLKAHVIETRVRDITMADITNLNNRNPNTMDLVDLLNNQSYLLKNGDGSFKVV